MADLFERPVATIGEFLLNTSDLALVVGFLIPFALGGWWLCHANRMPAPPNYRQQDEKPEQPGGDNGDFDSPQVARALSKIRIRRTGGRHARPSNEDAA